MNESHPPWLKLFVEPPADETASESPASEIRPRRKAGTRRLSPEAMDREIERVARLNGQLTIARPEDS